MAEEKDETQTSEAPDATEEQDEGIRTSVTWEGECECSIHAEVPAGYLEQRYEEDMEHVQKEAQVPGFRKGNAPRGLVQKRYGERLANDLLGSVIREAYQQAVGENDLSVVDTVEAPEPEDMDWEVGDPVEFDFTVQVLPRVEVEEDDYKGLEIDIPEYEVTEDMLEDELDRFAQQMASWEEVEEGGIDTEDYVVANVHVPGETEPAWSEEVEFVPSEKQIGPFKVEGIKGAITGAEAGDTIEIEGEIPEDEFPEGDSPLGEMVDEPLTLEIDIQEVYRRDIPEINDELAERFNMDDVEELRSFVRERLERNLEDQKEDLTRQILMNALLENFDMEMPDSLVQRATQDEMRRLMMQALRSGRPREEAEQYARSNAHRSRELAIRNLKTTYLLGEIADKERIYVLDDEVQEQVRALASRQGWTVERAQRYLDENDMMSSLRSDLRQEKTVEFLKENADINVVPADEFSGPGSEELEEAEEEVAEEAEEEAAEEAAEELQEREED